MLNIADLRASLIQQILAAGDPPLHLSAFMGWITRDDERLAATLKEVLNFTGQARHPEHIAALGFGASAGLLADNQRQILRDEIEHLAGRTFFSPGRPLRFEVDGIALLGVAQGAANLAPCCDMAWLCRMLNRSSQEVSSDVWQLGLTRLALFSLGEKGQKIVPPDLAAAAATRGFEPASTEDRAQAWELVSQMRPHNSGPGRDAVRLAFVDSELRRLGQVDLASTTRDDLIQLLNNVSRAMKRWTFESTKRTPQSAIARWEVENEYHVQNLLWAVLAPVFPDVDDEENLPSLGPKKPRADLGIQSLRTLIEVKFLRDRGQRALATLMEEIAADASLYLSRTADYDNIVVFVWDDCAQTEMYHELKSGIEQINGISAAIILPRPSSMARK